MADTEKSKLARPLSPNIPPTSHLPPSFEATSTTARAYLGTAVKDPGSGGCAAAGLNPHVSSECQPCSQWLSSAATGPGADIHGGLQDRKAAKQLFPLAEANKQGQK